MALDDPIPAYNAATNLEAQLVSTILNEAGIEAFAVEDLSTAGLWEFGTLPGIHKPQVWISRRDADRAQPILASYDRENADRSRAARLRSESDQPISARCEECGRETEFPRAKSGTIQDCPHCGAYLDVPETGEPDFD